MLPFIISESAMTYLQEGPIMTAELIKETEELVLRTGRYVKFSYVLLYFWNATN